MDELLTRFTGSTPCWNRDLLLRAGSDPADLEAQLAGLAHAGMIEEEGGVYWLTEAGSSRFRKLAAEWYLEDRPGEKPDNPAAMLAATALWLELERCNRQAGGEKDYLFNVKIPVRPGCMPLYSLDGGLRWLWPSHPDVPPVRAAATCQPGQKPAESGEWQSWRERVAPASAPLTLDLLLLCRYDMVHYLDFPGHPNDPMRLINADRFAFVGAKDIQHCLETLGKYQLWLHELRHLAISGYLDLDTQQQDSVNWLLYVTQKDSDAANLANELAQYGEGLIRPARPMELWTISLENLRAVPRKADVIWELLPFAGHAVWPRRM